MVQLKRRLTGRNLLVQEYRTLEGIGKIDWKFNFVTGFTSILEANISNVKIWLKFYVGRTERNSDRKCQFFWRFDEFVFLFSNRSSPFSSSPLLPSSPLPSTVRIENNPQMNGRIRAADTASCFPNPKSPTSGVDFLPESFPILGFQPWVHALRRGRRQGEW